MGRRTTQKRPRKAPGATTHIQTPPPIPRPSRYKPHPGEAHLLSLPIPELSGGRACRNCGLLESAIRRIDLAERKRIKKEKEAKKAQRKAKKERKQ